jgi:hypothetical protein
VREGGGGSVVRFGDHGDEHFGFAVYYISLSAEQLAC